MAHLSPERVRLIVVTGGEQASPRDLLSVVELALRGGAPSVQLRDKHRSVRELRPIALRLRELTHQYQALLFINDRVDLALSVHADGVHLGPRDLPVAAVRKAVPEHLYIGFSADDPDVARSAVAEGADYIGCGTVWPTRSKEDAGTAVGLDGLRRVAEAVSAPVVAIGGITIERAGSLPATGASGAAVVSAVMSAPDPGAAVRRLLEQLGPAIKKKDDLEVRD
jgi:thiamine-phosphate pyrophosphorylase